MKRLADLFERVDSTSSHESKAEALRAYFEEAPPEDAAIVRDLLAGRRPKRVISKDRLAEWARTATDTPDWLFAAATETAMDLVEAVTLLFPEEPPRLADPLPLHRWLTERIDPLRTLDAALQRNAVVEWWQDLARRERFLLNKLLIGDLRLRIPRAIAARATDTATATATATDTATATVTTVLVYAEPDRARRSHVLTELTLAIRSGPDLVPLAKVHAPDGLIPEEVNRLDRWIRANATARYGPVRHVPPEQLFALAFTAIEPSPRHKSGVTVTGPRITEWKTDATLDDVATTDALLALLPRS